MRFSVRRDTWKEHAVAVNYNKKLTDTVETDPSIDTIAIHVSRSVSSSESDSRSRIPVPRVPRGPGLSEASTFLETRHNLINTRRWHVRHTACACPDRFCLARLRVLLRDSCSSRDVTTRHCVISVSSRTFQNYGGSRFETIIDHPRQ